MADVRRSEWIKSVVVLVTDGRMMGAQELTFVCVLLETMHRNNSVVGFLFASCELK